MSTALPEARSGPAQRLLEGLDGLGRVQVALPAVLKAWAAAAPERSLDGDRFAALVAALDELAATGMVELPARRSWDRTVVPALPRFVRLPAARRRRPGRPWRDDPWCAELSWASGLVVLAEEHFATLVAVNRWLAGPGREAPVLPIQVRSLEIFGDEKRLLALTATSLFAPGRLSLELVAARRYPPPIAHERVGPGGVWLVVENSDSFWLTVEAARRSAAVDVVAWGAGRAVAQSLLSLAERADPVERILYWGDVDPDGVDIATSAAAAAATVGLPPVEPAVALWRTTASRTRQSEGRILGWSATKLDWLGPAAPAVAEVAALSARVAQEAVADPAPYLSIL